MGIPTGYPFLLKPAMVGWLPKSLVKKRGVLDGSGMAQKIAGVVIFFGRCEETAMFFFFDLLFFCER